MEFSTDPVRPGRETAPPTRKLGSRPVTRIVAMVMVALSLTGAGRVNSQQNQRGEKQPGSEAAAKPGAEDKVQTTMRDEQPAKAGVDSAGSEQKRQMNDDGMRLLKLANDLKAEVDKSNKDTLSIGVIRKADEIEKLAKSVREKLKHSMDGN